jgi:hypothetical protein
MADTELLASSAGSASAGAGAGASASDTSMRDTRDRETEGDGDGDESSPEAVVTPWTVACGEDGIDYMKLQLRFGCCRVTEVR